MTKETDSASGSDPAPQAEEGATTQTKKRRKKAALSMTGIARAMVAPISAVLGWFGRLVSSPLGKLALLLLAIFIFAPIDRLQQWVESKYDDQWHNPSREGLIVVDTPQLFTRERLVNERLEESAWIEQQLDKVDALLDAQKFAQVDSIAVTRSLLSVLGKEDAAALPATDFEKLGELAEKLGTTEPSPLEQFRDAKNYRESLNLQRYDSILDDAHDIGANTLHRMNFRLTLSPARPRSDSVAAVSITVQEPSEPRILFDHYGRLMVETRKKMEETVESLLRDRMLILNSDFQFQTSELELIDYLLKWQVIENGLVPLEDARDHLDADAAAQRYVETLVNEVLEQQRMDEEAKARAYLHTLITGLGIPSLSQALLPNYPDGNPTYWHPKGVLLAYAIDAPRRMIEVCGSPFKLTDLAPEWFSINGPAYQNALNEHVNNRLYGGGGPQPDPTPEQLAKMPLREQQAFEQRKANEAAGRKQISDAFASALSREFTYKCPNRENQITVAKLRLLGRFDLLKRVAPEPFAQCRGDAASARRFLEIVSGSTTASEIATRAEDLTPQDRLVAYIGSDRLAQEREVQASEAWEAYCQGSDLFSASQHLAERLQLTEGEYAQIGVVRLMKAKLTQLPLDSSARTLKLGQFFDFDIARCDLKTCKLRTRTKAETMADRAGVARMVGDWIPSDMLPKDDKTLEAGVSDGAESQHAGPPPRLLLEVAKAALFAAPDPRTIAETGREEALRLFLELRCFADARSYTVWPRSGERLASFQRDSQQSGAHVDLGTLFQGLLGFNGETAADTVTRQERDHIFGIGDWGSNEQREARIKERRAAGRVVPCSQEVEAVLDSYEPKGRFVSEFVPRLRRGDATEDLLVWWQKVDAELNREDAKDAGYCDAPPCEPTLENLMRIAQVVEEANTKTKFSWIIAPRRETPLRATRHVPMSVPLSALISLPSWWGHAELEVTTCWVRPKDLKARIPTGNLCVTESEEAGNSTRHTITVPLPGKAQDVLQRIGFFIIRTPYLDTGLGQEEEVEAGRSARIRLTGSRLWKNPRVRIGNQWHDRIEVLPNMQGVIATFNCIHPTIKPGKLTMRLRHEDLPRYGSEDTATMSADESCPPGQAQQAGGNASGQGYQGAPGGARQCVPNQNQPPELYLDERQAEIWTSEGRTSPTIVRVHAFRPRYFRNGEMEQPCWLKDDALTGLSPMRPRMAGAAATNGSDGMTDGGNALAEDADSGG